VQSLGFASHLRTERMGTELFKVTCVTCQASLSVRNPALIDQIVACPKCDSMVHIVPPIAVAPGVTAPVVAASLAVDRPTFEAPIEQFAEAAQLPVESDVPAEAVGVLDVTSASNANFIMWAVGSFVVGVTLMGTVLLWRSGSEPAVAAPQPATSVKEPDNAAEPTVMVADTTHTESPAPSPSPGDVAETLVDDENPVVEPAQVEPQPAEPSLLGPIEPPADEAAVHDSSATPPTEEPAPKLVIASADEPRVARKFDPLAVDPEELNLADMTEAGASEDNSPAGAEKPDEDQPQDEARPVNAVVPVRLDEESGRGSVNRVASIQLKREFPAVAVKDMPLLDFLTLVSQLAGVPVSVGPEQLQMAGVTPGRPVSVELTAATLAEVLASVLKPLHLEATAEGPQIVIMREETAKVRSVDYPVDDLLGENLAAADMGKWIETLIAPESWQAAGGDGTITAAGGSLKIEQMQAVQYQVLFFLERVRLAKELPLRSKYPARLLSGKPYGVGVGDRLNAPATFTFSHDTPLAEVFHYWQGEAGLPIFVDWPALASVGLWPDSRITCTSANEPWQTAFDKILSPLDLSWRAAPGGAIQISSRARVETEPVVDIYPAGQWHGDSTDAVVIDDPVNGLTYVRASAVAQRQ
jgi:hypothetical protein